MDEIKISAAIEAEEEQNEASQLKDGLKAEQNVEKAKSGTEFDGKTIGIAVIALLGLFVIAIGGFNAADWVGDAVTGAATTTIVDLDLEHLHADNRAGQLDPEQGYMYNDFSFVFYDELWWTEIVVHYTDPPTLLVVPLHYGPQDLLDVDVSGKLDSDFDNVSDVYISIDPNVVDQHYSLAISETSFNLVKGVGRKPLGACSEENSACVGREIISCEDNPNDYPVVQLVHDETVSVGSVEYDGMCIRVTGSGEEIVRAVDTMLLLWYQVME